MLSNSAQNRDRKSDEKILNLNPISALDVLRIGLPSKRIPIGKFSISEDYEILIIFKDSIGILRPTFCLTERAETVDGNWQFLAAQQSKPLNPLRLDLAESEYKIPMDTSNPLDLEPIRYAISFVNRTVQAMETRSLECRDFLDHAFRCAEWSSAGLDQFGKCVIGCVTGNHQLLLCARTPESWKYIANLSIIWYAYWCDNGIRLLNEKKLEFFTIGDDWKYEVKGEQESVSREPVVCTDVFTFYSGLMDTNITYFSWSRPLRKAKLTTPTFIQNCLLVGLHQSGTITFWEIRLPCSDLKQVRLLAVERSFFVPYEIPKLAAKPNFAKIIDVSPELFFLVIGFTDGRILGIYYKAYAHVPGSLTLLKSETIEILTEVTPFVSVSDVSYCCQSQLLVIAFGTRVLFGTLPFPSATKRYAPVVFRCNPIDCIFSSISGIHVLRNTVYFTAHDGLVANFNAIHSSRSTVHSPLNVIYKQSSEPGTFHKRFSGFFLSSNHVHLVFMEIAIAPQYCRIPSYLVFLSIKPQTELLQMLRTVAGPVRKHFDLLQELDRLVVSTKAASGGLNTSVDMDKEDDTQALAAFQDHILTQTVGDLSRIDLNKLQLWRVASAIFAQSASTEKEAKEGFTNLLRRLDIILSLRQMDKCFRLFLKTDVQRQASDCLLVLHLSNLCSSFLELPEVADKIGNSTISSMLKKATEVIKTVAVKLYIQRFKKQSTDLNCARISCCICRAGLKPDLFESICLEGHILPRCFNTFRPCVDEEYIECPSCNRCATFISSTDRPSQWKREISSPFCPFCGVRSHYVWF